jgi:hypothetical protein
LRKTAKYDNSPTAAPARSQRRIGTTIFAAQILRAESGVRANGHEVAGGRVGKAADREHQVERQRRQADQQTLDQSVDRQVGIERPVFIRGSVRACGNRSIVLEDLADQRHLAVLDFRELAHSGLTLPIWSKSIGPEAPS